jgi:hypothetical protein
MIDLNYAHDGTPQPEPLEAIENRLIFDLYYFVGVATNELLDAQYPRGCGLEIARDHAAALLPVLTNWVITRS